MTVYTIQTSFRKEYVTEDTPLTVEEWVQANADMMFADTFARITNDTNTLRSWRDVTDEVAFNTNIAAEVLPNEI